MVEVQTYRSASEGATMKDVADPELVDNLWRITSDQSGIDRAQLQELVDRLDVDGSDSRTRALFQASKQALSGYSTDGTPFPSLAARIKKSMKKTTIEQYLRELGTRLQQPTRLVIGGSSALILQDLLHRGTEDVYVVDEVPEALREMHEWRDRAKARYGLYIAHFQSHYLPDGWERRLHSKGNYASLKIYLVDPVDIFVGKVFSRREKDLDDLRVLAPMLDRKTIDSRLRSSESLLSDQTRRELAHNNYFVVFGEEPVL